MSHNNNNNNNDKDQYANVLDNYLKYISNLEANPRNDRAVIAELERRWRREMVKHPTIFAKCFSDNPSLLEEAKREVAFLLYQMDHPS
jgi:hypothetical protein